MQNNYLYSDKPYKDQLPLAWLPPCEVTCRCYLGPLHVLGGLAERGRWKDQFLTKYPVFLSIQVTALFAWEKEYPFSCFESEQSPFVFNEKYKSSSKIKNTVFIYLVKLVHLQRAGAIKQSAKTRVTSTSFNVMASCIALSRKALAPRDRPQYRHFQVFRKHKTEQILPS